MTEHWKFPNVKITMMIDKFDYTEWQRTYFDAKMPKEISREAITYEKEHPFTGNAVRLSHRLYPADTDKAARI